MTAVSSAGGPSRLSVAEHSPHDQKDRQCDRQDQNDIDKIAVYPCKHSGTSFRAAGGAGGR